MAITVPLRHELKFYINPVEYQVLSRQLDRVLERDPNGDENNEVALAFSLASRRILSFA